MADDVLDYSQPGPFTSLDATQLQLIESLPDDPVRICAAAQGLVIQPADATAVGIGEARLAEKNIRPVSELIAALIALDPSPLHQARTPETRVIGTCRHFATIACAFLRARGIPSRARCGFGTYFLEGCGVDHWITEYWNADQRRWVRVDTEHLAKTYVEHPEDLAVGEFLTGGEAWIQYRQGLVDGQKFGVAGVDFAWGPAEISGNAVRDLAALCKQEMLNWDEWGRMTDAYQGKTGPDYDELIDEVADACSKDDPTTLTRLFAREHLAVPHAMAGGAHSGTGSAAPATAPVPGCSGRDSLFCLGPGAGEPLGVRAGLDDGAVEGRAIDDRRAETGIDPGGDAAGRQPSPDETSGRPVNAPAASPSASTTMPFPSGTSTTVCPHWSSRPATAACTTVIWGSQGVSAGQRPIAV